MPNLHIQYDIRCVDCSCELHFVRRISCGIHKPCFSHAMACVILSIPKKCNSLGEWEEDTPMLKSYFPFQIYMAWDFFRKCVSQPAKCVSQPANIFLMISKPWDALFKSNMLGVSKN